MVVSATSIHEKLYLVSEILATAHIVLNKNQDTSNGDHNESIHLSFAIRISYTSSSPAALSIHDCGR